MGDGNRIIIDIWDILFFIALLLLSIAAVTLTILFIVGIISNPIVIPIIASLSFLSGLIILGILIIKVTNIMYNFFRKKESSPIVKPVEETKITVPNNSPVDDNKPAGINVADIVSDEGYKKYLVTNLSGLKGSLMGGTKPEEPYSPEKINIIRLGKDQ